MPVVKGRGGGVRLACSVGCVAGCHQADRAWPHMSMLLLVKTSDPNWSGVVAEGAVAVWMEDLCGQYRRVYRGQGWLGPWLLEDEARPGEQGAPSGRRSAQRYHSCAEASLCPCGWLSVGVSPFRVFACLWGHACGGKQCCKGRGGGGGAVVVVDVVVVLRWNLGDLKFEMP